MENEDIKEVVEVVEEATAPNVSDSPAEPPKEVVQPTEEETVRKRIDKVVWQREEARREADYWKRKAEEKPEAKQEVVDKVEPVSGAYPTWEAYTKALSEWTVQRELSKAKEDFGNRQNRERLQSSLQTFNERADKTREKYPDYDDLFESAYISEAMAPSIMESESGPELVVFLAKNQDIARKISRLSPIQAAREIGKIEAKLDDLLKPKVASDAPAPLKPVKPKGDTGEGLSDELDIKTWMKRRNKQLGR